MRVYCYTPFHMCRSNLLDLKKIEHWLGEKRSRGVFLVDEPADADVIVVTTCAFDKIHQDRSIKEVLKIKGRYPGARVIVGGCLPAIDPAATKRLEADHVFSPKTMDNLGEALGLESGPDDWEDMACGSFELKRSAGFSAQAGAWRALAAARRAASAVGVKSRGLETLYRIGFHYSSRTIFVRATHGCLGRCTYCAIRYARGSLVSRSPEQIVDEIGNGMSRGFRTAALVSDDISNYGVDIGTDLARLLEALARSVPGIELALDNVNPEGLLRLKSRIIPFLEQGLVAYIEVPVQSGSNRILGKMGRRYLAGPVSEALAELKAAAPDVIVATHAMVGFPGEGEQEFEDTRRWLQNTPVDHVTVLVYQDRPGTPAASMEPKVPVRVKEARRRRLLLDSTARMAASLFTRISRI